MRALDRFLAVHNTALASGKVADMKIADGILRKAVASLSKYSETELSALADEYEEAMSYGNYLSEAEAMDAVGKMDNSDGTKGAKWDADEFFSHFSGLGYPIEDKPNYNRWALWYTANMVSSYHSDALYKWSGDKGNNYAMMAYDFATSKLTDKDRPNWVREYLELD